MGKIDDMRRLREQQDADRTKKRQANPVPVVLEVVVPIDEPAQALATQPARRQQPAEEKKPTTTFAKAGGSTKAGSRDERGKCPDCGKMKPLQNGVLANHQKGFGKACAGSRKPPV